jgi:hypothetical protein
MFSMMMPVSSAPIPKTPSPKDVEVAGHIYV